MIILTNIYIFFVHLVMHCFFISVFQTQYQVCTFISYTNRLPKLMKRNDNYCNYCNILWLLNFAIFKFFYIFAEILTFIFSNTISKVLLCQIFNVMSHVIFQYYQKKKNQIYQNLLTSKISGCTLKGLLLDFNLLRTKNILPW